MRNRNEPQHQWESFDPVEWPDETFDIDDEAFALAIAEGRGAAVAA